MNVQTHVCIQQTVIDLLERGFEVHVVADATSSRSQMDRLLALQASAIIGVNLGGMLTFDTVDTVILLGQCLPR